MNETGLTYRSSESIQDFRALVQAIADHLPEWEYWPPAEPEGDDWCRIRHADGRYFCIPPSQENGRLKVSGGWPKHDGRAIGPYDLRSETPLITVAVARGSMQIAREIERRFLPAYTALWERAKAKIAEYQEYERKLAATQERICKALGEALPRDRYSVNFDDGWGNVEISSPESIDIKLHSLSVDRAVAIITTMKAASEEGKQDPTASSQAVTLSALSMEEP